MPDVNATDEEGADEAQEIQLIPERKVSDDPRRKKAVAALRSLRKKTGGMM